MRPGKCSPSWMPTSNIRQKPFRRCWRNCVGVTIWYWLGGLEDASLLSEEQPLLLSGSSRALLESRCDLGSAFLVVEHRLSPLVRDHYVRAGEHILMPVIWAAARSPSWIDVETEARRTSSYSGLKSASVGLNCVWANRDRLVVPGLWTIAAGLAVAAMIETPVRQQSMRTATIVTTAFALWAGYLSGGRRSLGRRGSNRERKDLYQVEKAYGHLDPLPSSVVVHANAPRSDVDHSLLTPIWFRPSNVRVGRSLEGPVMGIRTRVVLRWLV